MFEELADSTHWTSLARPHDARLYDVHADDTSAVRQFTDDPLPDETLRTILDNARFAPSGGNRQGTQIVVVRDRRDPRARWSS